MSLGSGRHWISPTRKREEAMTSKPVRGVVVRDGKVKPKSSYTTRNRQLKSARLAKAWATKSKGKP